MRIVNALQGTTSGILTRLLGQSVLFGGRPTTVIRSEGTAS